MARTQCSFDLCVSDPLDVDETLFHLWLEGLSPNDAARELTAHAELNRNDHLPLVRLSEVLEPSLAQLTWEQIVLSATAEQFRIFQLIKPHLDEPLKLDTHCPFKLMQPTKRALIDAYYSFDTRVMRELLGRQPTLKVRRELEARADRFNVSSHSCRLQFDNLQRIFQFDYDEHGWPPRPPVVSPNEQANLGSPTSPSSGPQCPPFTAFQSVGSIDTSAFDGHATAESLLTTLLCDNFNISSILASRYVHLVFLATHQFECQKRRLRHIPYADWEMFASKLMGSWCTAASAYELDTELARNLREIKSLLLDPGVSTTYYQYVTQTYEGQMRPMRGSDAMSTASIAPGRMRGVVKQLLELGSGLSNTKELRELFGSLAYLAEMFRSHLNLSPEDAAMLLECMTTAFVPSLSLQEEKSADLANCWVRFIRGLTPVVVRLMDFPAAPDKM